MKTDGIVDRFISALRQEGIEVEPHSNGPCVVSLESKLPRRFPASYASLLSRYRFGAFERGGIAFFGNTGERCEDDLEVAIFADRHLSEPLLRGGLLQVGRPSTGAYDPVCFDSRERKNRAEYALVVLEHEAVLQSQRLVVVRRVDDSFLSFMLHNGSGTA